MQYIAKNIRDQIFSKTASFERCNLYNCTFNTNCYLDRCNVTDCLGVDICSSIRSNIIHHGNDYLSVEVESVDFIENDQRKTFDL